MPRRTSKTGSELFIVDNSDEDWKVQRYLHDWCGLSKAIDVATGYFEIGGLVGLKEEWQKVDAIRILMGGEVSLVDSGGEIAKEARSILDASGLLNGNPGKKKHKFFVSDEPGPFIRLSERFLKREMTCVKRAARVEYV